MTIQYQTSNRTHGVFAEFDTTRANTATYNYKALIIGQKLTIGTAPANLPVLVNAANVADLFGANSQIASMVLTARLHAPTVELWAVPLADDGAAVAATGTVTATGTATGPGNYVAYLGGNRYPFNVATGDTAAAALTKLIQSICGKGRTFDITIGGKTLALTDASTPGLCTDATTATIASPITFKALNAGAVANDMGAVLNHRGIVGGETSAPGMTMAIVAPVNGATNPVLTTALANLAAVPYDAIIHPFTDTTSLNAIKTFLSTQVGRWAPDKLLFGHSWSAYQGTISASAAFGRARNDEHASVLPYFGSPDPIWEWAAAFGAVCSQSLAADPALTLSELAIYLEAPAPQNRNDDQASRNTLLYGGCSSWTAGDDAQIKLERVTTTFVTSAGVADTSYLDAETPATLAFATRFMRDRLRTEFARKKIVSANTIITEAMINTVSVRTIKARIVALYRQLELMGLVQNSDQFAEKVVVTQNPNIGSLVEVIAPFDLANQLRQIVMTINFAKP